MSDEEPVEDKVADEPAEEEAPDEFPEEWSQDALEPDAAEELAEAPEAGEEQEPELEYEEPVEEPIDEADEALDEAAEMAEEEAGEEVGEEAGKEAGEEAEEPPPDEEPADIFEDEEPADNYEDDELPLSEPPAEEEEENDADDDSGAIKREEDLPLDEVPEHLRDAVEGSLKIKKILDDDGKEPPAKRQKTKGEEEEEDEEMKRESNPEKMELLRHLRLDDDLVCRYVVEATDMAEVRELRKSNFTPRRVGSKKSCAEQLADQIVRLRERSLPGGSSLDPVGAFSSRWQLKDADDKELRKLSHKDLRFVIREYDSSKALTEIIDEAKNADPGDGPAAAATERPGPLTLGRFNRLELIDPLSEALVVGDANLTFSLILAEHRRDLGHTGPTVATTFEKLETLKERYSEIGNTIKELESMGAEVLHNVDCTRLGVDTRFLGKESKFGAVYYNFPHAGAIRGFFDNHPFVRWRHENLMHLFFRALVAFVKPGGSVKVASNSMAQGVRYSDIIGAAMQNEFVHVETVPFMEWTLRRYNRSYGDRRDATKRLGDGEIYASQRAHSDMVYCFCYAPSGATLQKPRIRYPPTKRDLMYATEGAMKNLTGNAKRRKVEELTSQFLSYVQGIHIG